MRCKRAFTAIAAVALVGAVAACSSSSSSAAGGSASSTKTVTNVVYGFSNANILNWATATVAYDPAFCAPYGVKVSPVILNTTAYTAAIDTGQVDFVSPAGNVLLAMVNGTIHNEKVVAYQGLNAPDEVVGIWADSQITSVKQLIGKTFGATSATSPSHLGALALLEHAGISPSQVNFTYLPSNSALQLALAHGTIQAEWNNGPLVPQAVSAGAHLVLPLSTDPAAQVIDGVYTVGNTAFMNAHPAATKGVLECLAAATKLGRSTNAADLSLMQANLTKHMGAANAAFAKEAWPEYPIAGGLLPMTAANTESLRESMSMQLQKNVPLSTIQGMVDTTYMDNVPSVPIVNDTGASQFPAYSGK